MYRMAAIVLFFSLACNGAHAQATRVDPVAVAPVFTALQRNAWGIRTDDKAAFLHVAELGTGEPVVFLHGGPGNDFHYAIDAFLPHIRRYRFVLPEQRGSLLSPVPPDKLDTLTFAALVGDLETLRRELGVERMTLFGHSFGSILAMAYLQAHPDRVERLVLSGAFPPDFSLKAQIAEMRPRQNAMMKRPIVQQVLREEGVDAPRESLTAQQRSRRSRIENMASAFLVDVRRWRELTGGGVYYNQAIDDRISDTVPDAIDIRATLVEHEIPVTVVQGDQDYVEPRAGDWTRFAKAHPDLPIRVHVIAGASHNAWIDNPDAFADALAEGLAADAPGQERK